MELTISSIVNKEKFSSTYLNQNYQKNQFKPKQKPKSNMKKSLLFLTTIFLSLSINSQVTRTQSTSTDLYKDDAVTLVKFKATDTTSRYTLYYQNAEYKHIVSLEYISFFTRKDFDDFFAIALEALETEESITITLRGKNIYLKRSYNSVFIAPERGYFTLSRKQIDSIIKSVE
jgi:hypothetical protein